jgi:hypothetical protein
MEKEQRKVLALSGERKLIMERFLKEPLSVRIAKFNNPGIMGRANA